MTGADESLSGTGSAGRDVLLEAAVPDLFRVNAFRVAQLAVEASPREVKRRAEKIQMLRKLGTQGDGTRGVLPLEPAPDAQAIREAEQRLHDPERRLVDEFFWFWPEQAGQSKTDLPLAALARGDVKVAAKLWMKGEGSSEANVSMHNLAILSHVVALDLEHAGLTQPLGEAQVKQRDACWQAALKRWRTLLEHEGFWSRLTARIRALEDVRLTTGTTRRMRQALPLALLGINAELAVRAAERGDWTEAERHMRLMRDSGFDPEAIERAPRRVLEPVRERIKTLCKSAERETNVDAEHADQVANRLLKQTGPLLAILDHLLAPGHVTREAAHDEVALCALACDILYSNKTKNWEVSLKLLEAALPAAASASARARIEQNITIDRTNLEHKVRYGTCWFCKKLASDDAVALEVKMHGEIKREGTWQGERITWRTGTIKVPRCQVCRDAHKLRSTVIFSNFCFGGLIAGIGIALFGPLRISMTEGNVILAIIIGVLGPLIGLSLVARKGPRTRWTVLSITFAFGLLPILVSLAAGILLAAFNVPDRLRLWAFLLCYVIAFAIWIVLVARILRRVRTGGWPEVVTAPEGARQEFPPIKSLLKEDWKFGEKPAELAS